MIKIILAVFVINFNLSLYAESVNSNQKVPESKVDSLNGVSKVLTDVNEIYKNNYSDIGLTIEYVKMIELVGASCSLLAYQNIVKLLVRTVIIGKEVKGNPKFEYKDLTRINEEMDDVYENLDYAFKNEGEACLALAPELKEITIEFWSRVYVSVEEKIKPYLNSNRINFQL